MGARIILAVAGAGKTYSICDGLPRDGKSLVLAFTNSNVKNIVQELGLAWKRNYHEALPETVKVMTFDSFVFRYCVAPYVETIKAHFKVNREIGDLVVSPPPTKKVKFLKKEIPLFKKDRLEHYVDKRGRFYLSNLTELIMFVRQGRDSLIDKIANSLNRFWDNIVVDEFQDFREFDSEFIMAIASKLNNILLVGDYYQHSVSAKGNRGKPFRVRKGEVSFQSFVDELRKKRFDVDVETLARSRRCPISVCDFISEKLGIDIKSYHNKQGLVKWVDANEFESIVEDDDVVKLVWEDALKCPFNANNWSYSKGDTYNKVCVILTEKMDYLYESTIRTNESSISRNKLYVALTRTSDVLYIATSNLFKDWKNRNRNMVKEAWRKEL